MLEPVRCTFSHNLCTERLETISLCDGLTINNQEGRVAIYANEKNKKSIIAYSE